MRHFGIMILLCIVLLVGCVGGPPSESSPTDRSESTENTEIKCDFDSETNDDTVSPQLVQTIDKYRNANRTDGIDIIIRVENSSSEHFNSTVSSINDTITEIKFVFSDQRLIAATAEPNEICQIANNDTVTMIGIDRKGESN